MSKLPRTFAPLTREDLPKAGDILALDAEFVSLQTVPYFITFTPPPQFSSSFVQLSGTVSGRRTTHSF